MKKIIIAAMATLATVFGASAQQKGAIELKLWEQGAPNSNELKEGDKMYHEATLTVYPAPKGRNTGMAVIACPGGGYSHLATAHEGYDQAAWYNAQGITFAVLVYRLPNMHKEVPLSDAQQAIRIMRQRGSEWGVSPNKNGIQGSSAGGHLAATAATHFDAEETVRPDFQILFYPVVSLDNEITHQGTRTWLLGKTPDEETVRLYCNELQVTPRTPQAFILHSSDDRAVPVENSLRYYRALVQNKVPVTMHLYPVGGHGWGFRDSFPYKAQWTNELEKWLREINK